MARRIQSKNHPAPQSVGFGSLEHFGFLLSTITANLTTAVPADYFVVPFACKIPDVFIVSNSGASGITAFNIAIGSAAEVGGLLADNSDLVGYPPQLNTTPGVTLFENAGLTAPADQPVNLAAYTAQEFVTSEPDAIFPQGTVLTLRLATGGAVAGGVKLTLVAVPIDIIPAQPTYQFNWLTSVG